MYNMNYKESKHMEEARKKYLKMVEEEPKESLEQISDSFDKLDYSIEERKDSENAYTEGYLQGLKDMITSAEIGFAIGCIIGVVINYLKNNLKNK